jgi:hypothetical protein
VAYLLSLGRQKLRPHREAQRAKSQDWCLFQNAFHLWEDLEK